MDFSVLKIPNHLGLIVDGNGRWASERGLSRSAGHEAGFNNLIKILEYAYSKNIKCVSAYLFSTENFKRSKAEVNFLMNLFTNRMSEVLNLCHKKKIKVLVSGRRENLSAKVLKTMDKIVLETEDYDFGIFNICFNYGGRVEIVDAAKKIVSDGVESSKIDEKLFGKYLYQDLPDVDFVIRTSGEQRLSNFMLWQCSYAEFYFPKVYFPDFDFNEFDKAIVEYTKRDRRFGGIDYEKKSN